MAVAAKLGRGDKGQSAGFSPGTLMLDFVVKCNETNTVIEQVRSEHIIEPPRGPAVADVLCKNENIFWTRGGPSGRCDTVCCMPVV